MFYKKQGLPGESELVICTVKRVLFHSVFVTLDEYDRLEGMIHISEVSPGRIRNIRDFVREGKKLVCKVLRVNKEKKQIDLSLRRVTPSIRKVKATEYKQQQKAEKILEIAAKKLKTDLNDIYKKIGYNLIREYGSLNDCFQKIIKKEIDLTKNDLPKDCVKVLTEIIKEKIKPPRIQIDQKISVFTNLKNGITLIKNSFKKAEKFCSEKKYNAKFSYISAPVYNISLTAPEYKLAEKQMKEITSLLLSIIKENKLDGEIIK